MTKLFLGMPDEHQIDSWKFIPNVLYYYLSQERMSSTKFSLKQNIIWLAVAIHMTSFNQLKCFNFSLA